MSLMNDSRACAVEINKMMTAPKPPIWTVEGAVEVYQDAYLFGHYDSRGGATLVVGARSGLEACIDYNRGCGWPDLSNSALEDILTPTGCEVYFVGRKPERLQDLDYGFADEDKGYLYARVQTRWASRVGGSWSDWENAPAWVFFPVPEGWEKEGPAGGSLSDLWQDCAVGDRKGLTKLKQFMPGIVLAKANLLAQQVRLLPDHLGEDACGVIFMPAEPLVEVNLSLEF